MSSWKIPCGLVSMKGNLKRINGVGVAVHKTKGRLRTRVLTDKHWASQHSRSQRVYTGTAAGTARRAKTLEQKSPGQPGLVFITGG